MIKKIFVFILKICAKKIIKKYKPTVIGITGSIGKTSVKEAIAAVLETKYNTRKNYKNYNNEIGVPLTIIGASKTPGSNLLGWIIIFLKTLSLLFLKTKSYPEMLVLEMGADKPGDIEYLTRIAPCKVGVLTYISHAHTEFFQTIKKISAEKKIIISHLQKDNFAVLNCDNEIVMDNAPSTKAQIITYGFKESANFRATDVNLITDAQTGWPTGLNFKLNAKGSIVPVFMPGIIAEHLITSVLPAFIIGDIFGINLIDASEAIRGMQPMAGHMRIIPGIKNSFLIDDTYNSSPDALKSALDTLDRINGNKKIAVLGDMLELGADTQKLHEEIGEKIAGLNINYIITVGEASKHIISSAVNNGFDKDKTASFADSISAGKFLQDKLEQKDAVLIKGSQGARMEKIVKEVMAEPLMSKELLVRQEDEWLNS